MDPRTFQQLLLQKAFTPVNNVPGLGPFVARNQEITRGGGDEYYNNAVGLTAIQQNNYRFKAGTGTPQYSTELRTPYSYYHGSNIGHR